jgi:hypothetical protein
MVSTYRLVSKVLAVDPDGAASVGHVIIDSPCAPLSMCYDPDALYLRASLKASDLTEKGLT